MSDGWHRDMGSLPTDPAEIKAEIEWVLDHPVWFFPYQFSEGVVDRVGGNFQGCALFMYVFVNPLTGCTDDNEALNTEFRVWLEIGPWYDMSKDPEIFATPDEGWTQWNKWETHPDMRLECAASTMPELLLELARLVRFFYDDEGERRSNAPEQCENIKDDTGEFVSSCVNAGDGYCKNCGFGVD
jgi:hypothetical protein